MAEKKERRNTFLQGFGKATIGICGIVALLSSFLCSVCPLINPSTFVWTAFFGLAFWMIFFANIIILIILICLKSRRTLLIPIVALLFSIPGIIKSYEYAIIPYILADDPEISSKDAFKKAKEIMKGNK